MSGRFCVWVIVLGDLGRSPRMVRHAESFSAEGAGVHLVGLTGSAMRSGVLSSPDIRIHRIGSLETLRRFGLAGAASRQLALAILLAARLVRLPHANLVMIQNPPAIPVLVMMAIPALFGRWPLWIDWHNTTRSMLQAGGLSGMIATAGGWLETHLARIATGHLAVSLALSRALASVGISTRILYDAPLQALSPSASSDAELSGAIRIVAPMSWSHDDDLDLLLEALAMLDQRSAPTPHRVIELIISGDGPRRQPFESKITLRSYERCRVSTTWIPPDEYVAFLSRADAGLSLHRSASGLDLPIKWVDIAQAGIPLLALDYGPVTRERLDMTPSVRTFRTADELATVLHDISLMSREDLASWRCQASTELQSMPLWRAEWETALGEVVDSLERRMSVA